MFHPVGQTNTRRGWGCFLQWSNHGCQLFQTNFEENNFKGVDSINHKLKKIDNNVLNITHT